MGIPEDPNDRRDWMVAAWKKYAEEFNVFVPDEHPTPRGDAWGKSLPEPTEDGTIDPQFLKHWRYLHHTKAFLRQRYEEHGILRGTSLIFDCLVPQFQRPLDISEEKRAEYRLPKKGDPAAWYKDAIKISITSAGEVGFECLSTECQRTKCKLNPRNKKRMSTVDLYSIIQMFHGFRSVAKAKKIVSEAFRVPIGKFDFKGIEQKGKVRRYAVPKHELHSLIERYSRMRRQHVPQLVAESISLIKSCELVELDHTRVFSSYFAFFSPRIIEDSLLVKINGPAIRLYLWQLVNQEEQASRNEFAVRLSDAEVARAIGVSRKTAGIYRKELQKLGLLKVKGDIWTVEYTLKSQRNT